HVQPPQSLSSIGQPEANRGMLCQKLRTKDPKSALWKTPVIFYCYMLPVLGSCSDIDTHELSPARLGATAAVPLSPPPSPSGPSPGAIVPCDTEAACGNKS
ncbi:hypothetical protein Vafri_20445, partial [Volvox africanus]